MSPIWYAVYRIVFSRSGEKLSHVDFKDALFSQVTLAMHFTFFAAQQSRRVADIVGGAPFHPQLRHSHEPLVRLDSLHSAEEQSSTVAEDVNLHARLECSGGDGEPVTCRRRP